MNPIEKYRLDHGLTYRELGARVGLSAATCCLHMHGKRNISAENAVRYEAATGIQRSVLRPDLWPPQGGAESGISSPATPIGGSSENFSDDK